MDQNNKTDFLTLSTTFSGWKSPVSSILLASNGFKYTGVDDFTKCVGCGAEIGNWQEGENVQERHYRASPNCIYVQTYANKFSGSQGEDAINSYNSSHMARPAGSSSPNLSGSRGLRDLSNGQNTTILNTSNTTYGQKVNTSKLLPTQSENRLPVPVKITKEDLKTSGPKTYRAYNPQHDPGIRPAEQADTEDDIEEAVQFQASMPTAKVQKYQDERSRLATYDHWPKNAPVQPPALAKAGLYYTGEGDKVKCPFCLGSMYNWEEGDIPKNEHAKHYPECKFMKFIIYESLFPRHSDSRAVARPAHSPSPTNQPSQEQMVPVTSPNAVAAGGKNIDFEELTAVKVVHQMGYSHAMIRDAVNRIPDYNPKKLKSDALLDVIFQMEAEGYTENSEVSESVSHEVRCEGGASNAHSLYAAASNLSSGLLSANNVYENGAPQATNIFLNSQKANFYMNSNQDRSPELAAGQSGNFMQSRTPEAPPSVSSPTSRCPNSGSSNNSTNRPSSQSANNDQVYSANIVKPKSVGPVSTPQAKLNPVETNPAYKKLSDEHTKLSKNKICNICHKDTVSILFLPCRHLIACEACSAAMKNCSECDKMIIGTVKIYLS